MQRRYYTEKQGLLGPLCPGQKALEGKTFYLDSVKKRATTLLLEAISFLGGRVESFLHRDVSFVVTGSQEDASVSKCGAEAKETSEEGQRPVMTRESSPSNGKQRAGTPRPTVCGSRGKALLEKAIRNNERLKGSGVLGNARSWGVKILYVDDVLLYLKHLTKESVTAAPKKSEKTSKQNANVVKAASLRSPYLKIEDVSRKYKPLHMQSMTFPTLTYSGRFSPFESPPPLFEKQQVESNPREKKKVKSSAQDKSQTPLSCNPSPWRPRKKDVSYCECCHQHLNNLEEHLQSDQHRAFVLDPSNYSVVDQLVVEMFPGFNLDPAEPADVTLNKPPSPSPMEDICDLELLSDVETEQAVQALQSVNTHTFSPSVCLNSCSPASPSPEACCPTPPADVQLCTAHTDSHPPLSPTMPVLDAEPQNNHHSHQLPGSLHPSPGLSSDPYSMPPVLSPQVSYPSHVWGPHSPYSGPPILSPQQYNVENASERNAGENVSEFLSAVTIAVFDPILPCEALGSTELVKRLNQESNLGSCGTVCSTGLENATLYSRRSRSLPRHSAMALNPKKRCRSASPECSRSKKRRIIERGHGSREAEKDIMVKPEGFSPNQKLSPAGTGVLTQTFTFCVPAQNYTPEPNQTTHGSTSFKNQSSWPLFFNPQTLDPPCRFNKSASSQDSQPALSHSTSVCIEPTLIPDLAALSSSSSDSDWDCELLSRIGSASAAPQSPAEQACELDKELLHRPCTWMHDTSYESRLHTVLQPSNAPTSICTDDMDPSAFSRTVVQIVQVQH